MLKRLVVRNDSWGGGHFDSSRGGSKHAATDYVAIKGEPVFAPERIEVIRISHPYADDLRWKGLYFKGLESGYLYKCFYFKPLDTTPGKVYKRGEKIGSMQGISEKYSPQMKDHLHVYMYKGNVKIDPEPILKPVKRRTVFPLTILAISLFAFLNQR